MGQVNRRSPQLAITVSQKDKRPLDRLWARWGGSIGPDGKGLWRWRLGGWESVETFLQDLRPYLLVKADQADVILSFMEHERELGVSFVHGQAKRLDDQQSLRRVELRDRLKRARFGANG